MHTVPLAFIAFSVEGTKLEEMIFAFIPGLDFTDSMEHTSVQGEVSASHPSQGNSFIKFHAAHVPVHRSLL